ncbi:alpha/beta hydrolase [Tersicoccus sp. Bi-70]|uniref:alpha/beta hydrolase n=1 Tax=Tersicoccus sp. Bi-70 TaxID=1897634 RepID=UPI00097A76A9|nr:alpha/beta hydrolase [Tersicoccus sp. Bi-70]OMH37575.1 alpha/beta hydrolase [Tersicoccus sp. Bi-70]
MRRTPATTPPRAREDRHRPGRRSRTAALVAVLAAVVLTLSGCVLMPGQDAAPSPNPSATAGTPENLKAFYTQQAAWTNCEKSFDCTKVTVPVDYAHPDGDTIALQLIRKRATGSNRVGSLVMNPGGPGGSGYTMVRDSLDQVTSKTLRQRFDVVSFDPRGVDRSAGITCLTDEQRDAYREDSSDPATAAGLARATELQRQLATSCQRRSGPVLGHMDTVSVARDLDVIRAVLGETTLNYLGYSYGTQLGATFADLFPARAGRLVLDGAVDPSLSNEQLTLGQAQAFEKALHSWAEACARDSSCAFTTADEGITLVRKLLADAERDPMTVSDGRKATVSMLASGLILPLYNQQSWAALNAAVANAASGDPGDLVRFSDLGADREQDGRYTANSTFAFQAVNCLDYPMQTDPAAMRRDAAALAKASPTLGRYFGYGGLTCASWPFKAVASPHALHAAGAAPIVVIGTTGDPATPVAWARSLADQLESGRLITFEGEGHTAYGQGNACVVGAVDGFLIDGTVPQDGLRCGP